MDTPSPTSPASPAAGVLASRWLPPLVLLLCVATAYGAAAWTATFLNFDDNLFFGPDNPLFETARRAAEQDGLLAGLRLVLDPGRTVADVYLPVSTGSLFLDYWWFDGGARGPHLVALLLHALASWALFGWLAAMRVDRRVALGAAVVFALHPALAESVAWVSSRKDVLCGLFVFLAMRATARLATAPQPRTAQRVARLAGIALLGALAMYSKATAVVQPLLAALVCLYTGGPRARWLAPLLLLLVTAPIAWHHQTIAAAAGTMVAGSALERAPQAPGAYLHYLQTALWPTGLNVLYPEVRTLAAFRAQAWPGALALLLTFGAALVAWRRPRGRAIGFGLLAFVVALLPFNTALPASVIAAADRYLYLAVPGLALAAVALVARLLRRPVWAAALLALPLLLLTWQRAPAFGDSAALWQASLDADADNAVAWLNRLDARGAGVLDVADARADAERAAAAARYPEHRLRAHTWLVQLAVAENRLQEAARQAEQAVAAADAVVAAGRAAPEVAELVLVRTLLAAITPLRLGGRPDEARAALRRAEQLRPDDPAVVAARVVLDVDELAAVLRRDDVRLEPDDRRAQAIADRLQAARDRLPEDRPDAQLELAAGTLERLRGNRLAAIAAFRRAQRVAPQLVDGWLGAAEVCIEAQLYGEAEDYARRGIVSSSRSELVDPRLRHALSRALAGQGRLEDAIVALEAYVTAEPRDRDAARLLSSLLMARAIARLSDPKVVHGELEHLIERALAVNPQEPRVDLVRARLLRDRGDFGGAVQALDRAIAALPEFADARAMLAENLRDLGYQRLWAEDDRGAAEAWLRLLREVPDQVPADAVRMQLSAVARRAAAAGRAALAEGELAAAEQALRRCLEIEPDHPAAMWLLACVLVDRPGADPGELDRLSEQALRWQQQHGDESSKQVVVRVLALRIAGRPEQALALARDYLAAPEPGAHEPSLLLLERLVRELGGD